MGRASWMSSVGCVVLVAWLSVFTSTAVRTDSDMDKYEVYAVRYATLANFRVSGLIAGADPSRRMDIAMMIWVLKGIDGRVAIVDSGFHRDQYFKQFAVKDFVRPSEAIAPLGMKPDAVTDIFLTHAHWDHAGGIDLFPNARVWLQKDEFEYYTGQAWQQTNTHGGIDPEDMIELVRRNTRGKLSLVHGDDDTTISGITFGVGGKHTWQSQFIVVHGVRQHEVVLASDNMYLYENLDTHKPIAQTLDAVSNLRTQDRMKSLASDPRFLIPGHDPAVFEKFEKVSDRIVRIE